MKSAPVFSLSRIASVALVISLLTTSTPAAPRTIVDFVNEQRTELAFWYYSSGLSKLIQGRGAPNPLAQEKQSDRDARVSRIQIYPGDVTVPPDQPVSFAAIAYDKDDAPVGGVTFKWSARDQGHNRGIRISPRGEFQSSRPGEYKIIAEGGGRRAEVKVTVGEVLPGPKRDNNPAHGRQVSNRDRPESVASLRAPRTKEIKDSRAKRDISRSGKSAGVYAHASSRHEATTPNSAAVVPMPQGGTGSGGWDNSNYWSSSDPGNGVGDPPGAPMASGSGSSNFQFAAPVYSSTARGINVSLGAAYNSRLWNKAGSQITYDIDRDWPAPGWALGFGKVMWMRSGGAMIVDADGTRHNYSGTVLYYNDSTQSTYFTLHTTDGTFIDYSGQFFIYYGSTYGSVTATLPNGTTINYFAYGDNAVYPTSIADANGNYIGINYVNFAGPRIQSVTDTMGRVLQFYYDSNNLLTTITAAGYNNGGARVLARFHYQQLSLNYSFSSMTAVVRNSYPFVIDAIYYPATNTGYWFGDSDSYSSYGMIRKVSERRNMSFSCPDPVPPNQGPTAQCTINSTGLVTREETYNYPLYPGDSDPTRTQSSNLSDAPTYATATESWTREGTSTMDQAITNYSVNEIGSPRTVEITLPNGTKSKQYSYNHPGQFDDGLVYHDVTFVNNENTPLQSSDSSWEPGAYNTPRPTQVQTTDERGQTKTTLFSYGTVYNQVTEVRDYDYDGSTLLRSTQTSYQNSSNYTNRHIFNLPLTVEVFDGSYNRVARTEYQYDGQTLTNTPDVIMHSDAANPFAPPYWVDGYWDWRCHDSCDGCNEDPICDWVWIDGYWVDVYQPATDYRGNVTQITSYATVTSSSVSDAVTETRRYDMTGNMVTASTSCCEQTSFNYTINTQYAYPESKTRGSSTDWYAQVTTSAVYDFNTGLGTSAKDANGQISATSYNPNTLRPITSTAPTGAHTDYNYDDTGMKVTATTLDSGGGIADQNEKYLNGTGQVRIEKARGPDNNGNQTWDEVDTTYNNLGQVYQQSRPYRVGSESPTNSTVVYDALGRTKTVTTPDGSVTEMFYNELSRPDVASSLPGETTRVRDAWGRERWGRTDASGRLVEVVEPVFWGNGSVANGMQTTYAYNALGKLITINSMSGATVQQQRRFRYDSLGRLTAQKLAETNATLNDSGVYIGGNGTWSDVFTYDGRSNLTSSTDARGVKTVYNYNNDSLNRLQTVSWDTSGFGDTAYPILEAKPITYSYRNRAANNSCDPLDSSGRKDVTQVASVSTENVSTQNICYDTEGRVSSKILTLNSRSDYPFATDYTYDSLDRLWRVLYPREWGNGSGPRKLVEQTYDIASRLTSLTFDGQTQASNIIYNAVSQTTSLKVGTSSNEITENYSYNAQTGLLESQTVAKTATPTNYLLNLSYDYAGPNGKRTGQLTKIYNNLDNVNKDRGFEYDALGRLIRATGGQGTNNTWVQKYEYDRYGNRSNVYSFGLEDYVRNFYQGALNRQPNSTELTSALSTLRSAYSQGQSQFLTAMQNLGESLFNSSEYAARGRDNHWYVYDLYRAYLYREPDGGGWANWEAMLNNGSNRAEVRNNFAWAPEFYTKVAGISPYAPPVAVPRDGSQGVAYDQATNRVANEGWYYDAAGNQTRTWSNGVWQKYQYDAANRLVRVKNDSDVIIASYTYGDSNERLIAQDGDGNSNYRTYYVGEGGATIAEYTETPSLPTTPQWSKSYVYLGNRLLSTLTPNGGGEAVEYHHPDRLGTRIITNPSTGTWSEQATLPFGTALSAESSGNPSKRRFTSYDRSDATKLDYAVNRHYDSQQGRFTQVDPAGMGASDIANPQSLNLFAYCGNDPINRTDADGLGLISALKGAFKKILKAFVHAVIVGVFAFLTSGFNIGAALAMFLADFAAELRMQSHGYWGTPQWNPNSSPIFVTGVGSLSRYIIVNMQQTGQDPDVLRIWTWAPGDKILALMRRIKQALCKPVPRGRVSGVSATGGVTGGPTGGVEYVQNFRSGQISGFAFGGAQVGFNGVASGNVYTGYVWGLNNDNSNYSGGFSGVNGPIEPSGTVGLNIQASSDGLTKGFKGMVPDPRGVKSATIGVGKSLLGSRTAGFTATHYSPPLQMGRWWAQAMNGVNNNIDAPLIVANQICR